MEYKPFEQNRSLYIFDFRVLVPLFFLLLKYKKKTHCSDDWLYAVGSPFHWAVSWPISRYLFLSFWMIWNKVSCGNGFVAYYYYYYCYFAMGIASGFGINIEMRNLKYVVMLFGWRWLCNLFDEVDRPYLVLIINNRRIMNAIVLNGYLILVLLFLINAKWLVFRWICIKTLWYEGFQMNY